MITRSLFYCYEMVFIHMDIWMIRKNSMKVHHLKKEDFHSHLNMKDNTDADYAHAKKSL